MGQTMQGMWATLIFINGGELGVKGMNCWSNLQTASVKEEGASDLGDTATSTL
jgi:hypothetical protein